VWVLALARPVPGGSRSNLKGITPDEVATVHLSRAISARRRPLSEDQSEGWLLAGLVIDGTGPDGSSDRNQDISKRPPTRTLLTKDPRGRAREHARAADRRLRFPSALVQRIRELPRARAQA